jgi:crotonobetainyl-CoA:carnitine CoA-transferase CaiB-like acyl-CoA transferase
MSALDDVRVLEIGEGYAAPFATRLMADLGADVVKVEDAARGGDPVRGEGPRLAPGSERGGLFEYLNWNKRSVALTGSDPDREELDRLVAAADIVVVGDRLELLERWRISPAELRRRHPQLVVVTVSAFGAWGPYRDFRGSDLVLQAMGGLMAFSGLSDREPLKRGLRQTCYTAALTASYAGLGAYYARLRSGQGARVDVSIMEAIASELILNCPSYAFMGAIQGRRPASKDPFAGEPIACKDGYVTVQTNTWITLPMFGELLGDDRLADERFDSRTKRSDNADQLVEVLEDVLSRWAGRDLFEQASQRGMLSGFVQDARQLLACPHLAARGVFHTVPGSDGPLGPWRLPAVLAQLSRTPATVRSSAPALGEYGGAPVWSEPRPAAGEPNAPRPGWPAPPEDTTPRGPLHGLRVLDLSTVVAVPLLGAMLRDLGADVIKVEAPDRLDQGRGPAFGPLFHNETADEPWNRSGSFQSLNRGKRAIALDARTPEGREVLLQLTAGADILLENFTPRVLRGWGLTYDVLAERNPGLIMLSNTGYGATGPWSSFKAQGTTLEATMGVGSYCGYRGDKPTKVGQSYPDFIACWTGLTSLFAALVERTRSGLGQHLDLGMYQLGPAMIPEAFVSANAGLLDPGRTGNEDLDALVSGVVPAAGEDRWLAFSVADPAAWRALAALVPGVPGLSDESDAPEEAAAVVAAVAAWAADQEPMAAAERLQAVGVAAGRVNDARDLLLDRHLLERGLYEDHDYTESYGPEIGVVPVLGRGFRWQADWAHVGIRGHGPRFGSGNDEVLAGIGYDDEQRAALRARGVLVDVPVDPPALPPSNLASAVASGYYREIDPDFADRLRRGRGVLDPA